MIPLMPNIVSKKDTEHDTRYCIALYYGSPKHPKVVLGCREAKLIEAESWSLLSMWPHLMITLARNFRELANLLSLHSGFGRVGSRITNHVIGNQAF